MSLSDWQTYNCAKALFLRGDIRNGRWGLITAFALSFFLFSYLRRSVLESFSTLRFSLPLFRFAFTTRSFLYFFCLL